MLAALAFPEADNASCKDLQLQDLLILSLHGQRVAEEKLTQAFLRR